MDPAGQARGITILCAGRARSRSKVTAALTFHLITAKVAEKEGDLLSIWISCREKGGEERRGQGGKYQEGKGKAGVGKGSQGKSRPRKVFISLDVDSRECLGTQAFKPQVRSQMPYFLSKWLPEAQRLP